MPTCAGCGRTAADNLELRQIFFSIHSKSYPILSAFVCDECLSTEGWSMALSPPFALDMEKAIKEAIFENLPRPGASSQ